MTRDEIQKVRAALVAADNAILSVHGYNEALAILDAALAAPEQEPVVYWDGDRSVIPADDVSYFPNWTDYYPTPLYRHPAPQSQPIARVTGYYGGNCVIEPLDGKTVFSSGMAVYSAPVAAQSAQPIYMFRRKGLDDFCTCTKKRYDELATKPHLFDVQIAYTAPPSREWQGFSYEEVEELQSGMTASHREVRAIESALRAKNSGEQA